MVRDLRLPPVNILTNYLHLYLIFYFPLSYACFVPCGYLFPTLGLIPEASPLYELIIGLWSQSAREVGLHVMFPCQVGRERERRQTSKDFSYKSTVEKEENLSFLPHFSENYWDEDG